MEFENTFEVDAPVDEVYAALLDVGRVAPCVPGAQVFDRTGEDAYEVGIKVKVGPMSMLYKGTVEIVDRDPVAHTASMRARARESRGQGMADALVRMALTGDGGTTRGTMSSDVKLSGKAAAMGGGVIRDVSAKLVDQFAQNLAAMLSGEGVATQPMPAATGTQPTPAAAEAAGPATPTEPAPADAAPAAESTPATGTRPTPAAAAAAGPATPSEPPRAQSPAEADALEIGGLVGPVLLSRLRDPKVLGGLGLLIAILLLLRRRS
jgi:carbon monoxide dehydrogenase subunit G